MCKPSPTTPPSNSPMETTDPLVRSLNTLIFGLLVHFLTIWSIQHIEVTRTCTPPSKLPTLLLLHEYWVYLQHTNVLSNPHLQHLDRQYGIALLRNNQHWAIAGTLSSYWCRESVGMFLLLPYLDAKQYDRMYGFSQTQYLILYSLVYHTIKSRGVRSDAISRHSSQFGIMRLVIDRFYHHSLREFGVSLLRLFLQGFDTYIHYCIVQDLMGSGLDTSWLHMLFGVWVVHAALNQLFRCSTASVIVQCWHLLTAKSHRGRDVHVNVSDEDSIEKEGLQSNQQHDSKGFEDNADIIKCNSLSSSCSSASETTEPLNNDKFIVRHLLHSERVPNQLKGREGSASKCVDIAVRIETVMAVISVFFMVGLGEVPLRGLTGTFSYEWGLIGELSDMKRLDNVVLVSWVMLGVLHGLWVALFKTGRSNSGKVNRYNNRWASVANLVDMSVMLTVQTIMLPKQWIGWVVCASIATKSFLQTQRKTSPRLFRIAILGIEFVAKLALLRVLLRFYSGDDLIVMLTTFLTLLWMIGVICNPIPTPCELTMKSSVADAVFLGHPAELSDSWALWLLPYSLNERWKPPFWAVLHWPFHYIVGIYVCKFRRRIFGDGASYFCCDDVCYGHTRMQNWVAAHFARHFVTHKNHVRYNIEAAARHAEKIGVKVFCLGALNKAESINGGGVGVVKNLGPNRRLSVIHGNHLTAAAVVETIHQCYEDRNTKFFLTGASSKVGWAVAQALKDSGYQVLCHSTDLGRRKFFEKNGFTSASTLTVGAAFTNNWIVGKYDRAVAQEIPQNSIAVVFSVPHPLASRKDVRVIEAGTLHIDLEQLDRPRMFTNKLKAYEIFACHAASAVAVYRLRSGVARIDEVGPVDTKEMDTWLADAKMLGFSVPQFDPIINFTSLRHHEPPVVIVGAGPAGLCAAAGLSVRNIPFVILESETNPSTFGSWDLLSRVKSNVTTQKKWCSLAGYEMNDRDFPGEFISPDDYQRYLQLYANRFSLTSHIRRGAKVVSIKKNNSEYIPWRVQIESEEEDGLKDFFASSVIIATGKHRVACANTDDDVVSKLNASNIPFVHSANMSPESWKLALQAANNGSLCIVGFGNSAADISSVILQTSTHSNNDTRPMIHIATRTVPPVFPQKKSFLRVDTLGYILLWFPLFLQEYIIKLLWRWIPDSQICNAAFPVHLKRWSNIHGRIPVIDKGFIASGFETGQLKGHGQILSVNESKEIMFFDHHHSFETEWTKIDMVILATGYKEDCVVDCEDRPSGLYKLGFGNDNYLPLQSMCNEAQKIVQDIAAAHKYRSISTS